MGRIWVVISAVIVLCLGCVYPSWARLSVAPHLTLREEFNDNIFLSAVQKENDFITRVRPGLAVSWPANYFHLNVDYGFDFLIFEDHTELNETSFSNAQRGFFDFVLLPDRDFSVDIRDEISRVTIDERRPTTLENSFLNKTNVNHFSFNPKYRFHSIRTVEAIFGYRYETFNYQSNLGDDSNINSFYINLNKKFSNRFNTFLDYELKLYQAKISEDYQRQDLQGGFSYLLNPRLTILISGGGTAVDFKNSGDHTFGIWRGRVEYRATEKASYFAEYSNGFQVSVIDGLFQREAVEVGADYDGKIQNHMLVFARDATYQSIDRKDRSLGGVMTLIVPLDQDFSVVLDGNYTYYRFLPEGEDVQRYGIGSALNYQHKIFFCSIGYFYQRGLSDISSNEYLNNVAYIQFGVNFGRKEKNNKFLYSLR